MPNAAEVQARNPRVLRLPKLRLPKKVSLCSYTAFLSFLSLSSFSHTLTLFSTPSHSFEYIFLAAFDKRLKTFFGSIQLFYNMAARISSTEEELATTVARGRTTEAELTSISVG